MVIDTWKVYWSEMTSAYLYGSLINVHDIDHVTFQNPLMPPSNAIVSWYSKTNFWGQRAEPALPIIDETAKYRLIANYETEGQGNCFLRMTFFNRLEEKLGELCFRDKEEEFVCPPGTYSYKLELINGGIKKIDFRSIEIQEIEDDTETELA